MSESWLSLIANSALQELDCWPLLVLHFGISKKSFTRIFFISFCIQTSCSHSSCSQLLPEKSFSKDKAPHEKLYRIAYRYSVQQTDKWDCSVILMNSYILDLNFIVGSYAHRCHIFSTVTYQAQAVEDFFMLSNT